LQPLNESIAPTKNRTTPVLTNVEIFMTLPPDSLNHALRSRAQYHYTILFLSGNKKQRFPSQLSLIKSKSYICFAIHEIRSRTYE
jgi:hypothetical protein